MRQGPVAIHTVGQALGRHPNMSIEIGARIGELGRQPRAAARFFDRYQDRILFGTDAIPPPLGNESSQQIFSDELYEIYFRFLETEDEYFDYAPAPVPPQGRWRIYGLGLSESILRTVYYDNASRLLNLGSRSLGKITPNRAIPPGAGVRKGTSRRVPRGTFLALYL